MSQHVNIRKWKIITTTEYSKNWTKFNGTYDGQLKKNEDIKESKQTKQKNK